MNLDLGLILFTLGQTIMVIIFCGFAFNGIMPTINSINEQLTRHYQVKKQRLQDKLEIEQLKIHLKDIEKVEPHTRERKKQKKDDIHFA